MMPEEKRAAAFFRLSCGVGVCRSALENVLKRGFHALTATLGSALSVEDHADIRFLDVHFFGKLFLSNLSHVHTPNKLPSPFLSQRPHLLTC